MTPISRPARTGLAPPSWRALPARVAFLFLSKELSQ